MIQTCLDLTIHQDFIWLMSSEDTFILSNISKLLIILLVEKSVLLQDGNIPSLIGHLAPRLTPFRDTCSREMCRLPLMFHLMHCRLFFVLVCVCVCVLCATVSRIILIVCVTFHWLITLLMLGTLIFPVMLSCVRNIAIFVSSMHCLKRKSRH